MYNLIDEVSKLTQIPNKLLDKLVENAEYAICYDVKESLNLNEESLSIDIGIGNISILISDREILYKFIPSKSLEKNIITSIKTDDVLTNVVEKTLKDRIINTYKELL